ncbi:MAG: amidohydrolase [Phycisphaerae bacterium]|nr:amidohydrolase [Phycisphaerae bacterium]
MIIDTHGHYGEWAFASKGHSVEYLVELLERYGIDTCILSSSLGVVYDFREGNSSLASTIQNYPQLLGYIVLNPNYLTESIQELEKYAHNEKFVGIKIHSDYTAQEPNFREYVELLRVVDEKYPQPLLVHVMDTAALAEAAVMFPKLNFIAAHMGEINWKRSIKNFGKLQNVYVDISGASDKSIEEGIESMGVSRILFGTDLTLISPAEAMGKVYDANISEKDRELIFSENARALFDF